MVLKDTCRCASALILMFGAITTSAVASAIGEGYDWNMQQPRTHIVPQNSHRHVRHHLTHGPGYATVLPGADANSSDAAHFIRVGPNGYWVTGSWGCWVEEAQDRIVDCDSANR
jgi:hypothetical protein